jgi:hypothetical protein
MSSFRPILSPLEPSKASGLSSFGWQNSSLFNRIRRLEEGSSTVGQLAFLWFQSTDSIPPPPIASSSASSYFAHRAQSWGWDKVRCEWICPSRKLNIKNGYHLLGVRVDHD